MATTPVPIDARRDFTLRWSFRHGDYLLWLRAAHPLLGAGDHSVIDFWELRDGDFATITNRPDDIPAWFELHPTEVCNALAHRMAARLAAGYQPGDVLDGPNVWRVRAGDRLAWVGAARAGLSVAEGVLGVLNCRASLLVLGEGSRADLESFLSYGAPMAETLSAKARVLVQAGVAAANALGAPREHDIEWLIG